MTWPGDSNQLPLLAGNIPPGYTPGPGFRSWVRDHDKTDDWFVCGPYEKLDGAGTVSMKVFGIIGNRGSGAVLYTDAYDNTSGQSYFAHTFDISEFPTNSDGFAIFYPDLNYTAGHKFETRIMCKGGANVNIYMVRWEVSTL
jgi:hypothetical protein